jgi:hypothetical protein
MAVDCTLGTARSKSSRWKSAAGPFYPEETKGDVLQVVPIDYPTRIVILSERSESKDLSATGKLEFTLADVYAHAAALAKLHLQSHFRFLVSTF